MYCCHCGKEIHDEAVVCVHCGHNVDLRPRIVEPINIKVKKYCQYCGNEVNDNAEICLKCGCRTGLKHDEEIVEEEEENNDFGDNESKTAVGVLMALFLGLIGLCIGFSMYPRDTEARRTFITGWTATFVVSLILSLIIVFSMLSKY